MPDFIFLSEPQIYKCDVERAMSFLKGEYSYYLNSSDIYDPDLPLIRSKDHGGTMILWKHEYSPNITIKSISSTAFLPIVFQPPGLQPSIHIAVYLPTSGRDSQFLDELTSLSSLLVNLSEEYPGAPIHLRGDFNVNSKNLSRVEFLTSFINEKDLNEVIIDHTT